MFFKIKVKDKSVINSKKCRLAIRQSQKLIKKEGRMLIRKSGTEPKIRVMAESYDKILIKKCISKLRKIIK